MMKKPLMCLLFALCFSPVYSGIDDGFLTAEDGYQGAITWRSYDPPLIVDGGGAVRISVKDNGRLIVQSTSTPLQMLASGVYDILLGNNAQLLYSGGVTEFIGMGSNATAVLRGGSINYIKAAYFAPAEHVLIYAQEDSWSWVDNNPLKGVQGLWLDNGLPFRIEFINDPDYSPTWMNVKVVPEPATMLLVALGGLIFRKQKRAN